MAPPIMKITAIIHPHICNIARENWEACLPCEAENYDYYTACETLAHDAYKMSSVEVKNNNKTIAVAPLFTLTYRLDTPLQGKIRKITNLISKCFPNFLALKVLGIGSPLAERCHLGFAPELTEIEHNLAITAVVNALNTHAKQSGIGLIAFKDLDSSTQAITNRVLKEHNYTATNSLPIAVLDVPETYEAYLSKLSPNNRSSFKRKIRAAKNLIFECRTSIKGIEDEIAALYEETREHSGYDYGDLETLPKGYFEAIMQAAKGKALMMLYWLKPMSEGETQKTLESANARPNLCEGSFEKKGQLIGFNLLFLHEGTRPSERKVIDKFIGRKQSQARENNLYFVGWMDNLRYAQTHGYKMLQTGQTAYGEKLRLGSRLEPSFIYFRHRNWLLNKILRFAAKFIAFDKMDKDLQDYQKNQITK
jgi:hypothetical protein